MSRSDWIQLDVGLLDDDVFGSLSAPARGAWVTAYLIQKRRGGAPFKDHAELCRLLRKEGIEDPDERVRETMGLLEQEDDGPAIGIRDYTRYQKDRGPSDDPAAKAERNARRPTTRAGRMRGASVERVERQTDRQRDTSLSTGGARASARGGAASAREEGEDDMVYDDRIDEMRQRGSKAPEYADRSREHPAPDPEVKSMEDFRSVMARIKEKPAPAPRKGGRPGS